MKPDWKNAPEWARWRARYPKYYISIWKWCANAPNEHSTRGMFAYAGSEEIAMPFLKERRP